MSHKMLAVILEEFKLLKQNFFLKTYLSGCKCYFLQDIPSLALDLDI